MANIPDGTNIKLFGKYSTNKASKKLSKYTLSKGSRKNPLSNGGKMKNPLSNAKKFGKQIKKQVTTS